MRAALILVAALWLLTASAAHGAAERIISLAPSITEVLFALGLGPHVIGVSTYCDYPPEALAVDKVGTFLSPNIERILAKKPDLVIAVPSPANRNAVELVRDLGLKVLVVDPESVASIFETIRTIAEAAGVPQSGVALRNQIESRLAHVRRKLDGVVPRSVLMAVDHRPLIVAGAGTYQDELIDLAGGRNLGRQAGKHWPQVGVEFVVAQAPEVIVDTTMGPDETAKPTDFWDPFTTIPAVRERRIYGARAFVLLRPGPRIVEGVETMARFIHPERFAAAVIPACEAVGEAGECPILILRSGWSRGALTAVESREAKNALGAARLQLDRCPIADDPKISNIVLEKIDSRAGGNPSEWMRHQFGWIPPARE